MNKRKKYAVKVVSVECLGCVRSRLIMSGKLVLSVSRDSLASEIVRVFNKHYKPMNGQLAVWYEVVEVPSSVITKPVHSLTEFVEAFS